MLIKKIIFGDFGTISNKETTQFLMRLLKISKIKLEKKESLKHMTNQKAKDIKRKLGYNKYYGTYSVYKR